MGEIKVYNPDWPKGITAQEWLDRGMWREFPDNGDCISCGRRAESPLKGHDGFCPIPFLASALLRLEETERLIAPNCARERRVQHE